jgi:hypothetical protein
LRQGFVAHYSPIMLEADQSHAPAARKVAVDLLDFASTEWPPRRLLEPALRRRQMTMASQVIYGMARQGDLPGIYRRFIRTQARP